MLPEPGPEHAETITIPRDTPSPGRRRRWPRRLFGAFVLAALLGAAAYGVWEYLIPHYHDVPQLVGTDLDRARARLSALGYVVALGEPRHSDRIESGQVLETDPSAGRRVEEGATITVIPSSGPPPVRVPDVAGMSRTRAAARLEDAGLGVGRITRAFSERVAEGHVIRRRPNAAQAPRGSEIDLVLSKGPPPRPVPAVVGGEGRAGTATLQAEGFQVRIVEQFSDSAPRGTVMGQSPEGGTTRAFGSTVTLTVSKGPERFRVTDYRGMSEAEAVAAIEGAGLVADVQRVPNAKRAVVRGQDPKPGTVVRNGDTITIFIG